jgi:hypothetical protein
MKGSIALLACAAVCGVLGAIGCQGGQVGSPAILGAGAKNEAACTILLYVLEGEGHVQEAEEYRRKTEEHTGWGDVYVVHHSGYSELYRGRYPSAEAAMADLKQAKGYRTPVGIQLFAQAMVMPLPQQPAGRFEYDLTEGKGAFTVVVAEFYDVPEAGYVGRRSFAQQYCRQLRTKGEEAYVLHGPVKSLVSIGSFPESSYPTAAVGNKLQRVVRDPRMEEALKRFPDLAVNGRRDVILVPVKDGKRKEKLATASYVLEIPPKEAPADAAPPDSPGDAQRR